MDGCSIAWAALSYLITNVKCFTLFVTHYAILANMETELPGRVGNYHMSFLENDEADLPHVDHSSITFLYKLTRGASKRSYGLNVGRLAGVPDQVLERAAQKYSKNFFTLPNLISSKVG